jgi:hypothetical protein
VHYRCLERREGSSMLRSMSVDVHRSPIVLAAHSTIRSARAGQKDVLGVDQRSLDEALTAFALAMGGGGCRRWPRTVAPPRRRTRHASPRTTSSPRSASPLRSASTCCPRSSRRPCSKHGGDPTTRCAPHRAHLAGSGDYLISPCSVSTRRIPTTLSQ